MYTPMNTIQNILDKQSNFNCLLKTLAWVPGQNSMSFSWLGGVGEVVVVGLGRYDLLTPR